MIRSKTCPQCGSVNYRNVAPETAHLVYDRICRECDTRYTPPTPNWMAAAGVFAGLAILAIMGVVLIGVAQNAGALGFGIGDAFKLAAAIVFFVSVGGAGVIAGVRHFRSRKGATAGSPPGQDLGFEHRQSDEP